MHSQLCMHYHHKFIASEATVSTWNEWTTAALEAQASISAWSRGQNWNSLPQSFRDATLTLRQFQSRIKTSLFRLAYGRNLTAHSWLTRLLERRNRNVWTELNWTDPTSFQSRGLHPLGGLHRVLPRFIDRRSHSHSQRTLHDKTIVCKYSGVKGNGRTALTLETNQRLWLNVNSSSPMFQHHLFHLPAGLLSIRPSTISCKCPSVLKTCPTHRHFFCSVYFNICLQKNT